ncbi:unnamed protein product, partial [Cladocopium goreaui]
KLGPLVGCAMSPCAPKLLPCCISRLWMGLIAILTISLSIWLSFTSVDRHWHRWPSLLVSGAVADVSGCFPLWARLAHDQARLGNVSVGHHAANLLPKARRIGSRKALREENEHHYIDKSATPDLLDFAMSMLWEALQASKRRTIGCIHLLRKLLDLRRLLRSPWPSLLDCKLTPNSARRPLTAGEFLVSAEHVGQSALFRKRIFDELQPVRPQY